MPSFRGFTDSGNINREVIKPGLYQGGQMQIVFSRTPIEPLWISGTSPCGTPWTRRRQKRHGRDQAVTVLNWDEDMADC